jgi:hypothetical protein
MKIWILLSTSISELSPYQDFCLQAATKDDVFYTFKSHPSYQSVLEHVSYSNGEIYLKIILEDYPYILNSLDPCRDNDRIGQPQRYIFGKFGAWSPTTLRYMKVAGDLESFFGDLRGKSIVEIGGGYGGQCKIIHELFGFKSYTIIDLKEVALLTNKYLKTHLIDQALCVNPQENLGDETYDLLISNYAFSEISEEAQLIYIENVINRSKSGYMTYNFISELWGVKSLSLDRFLELISIPGREITILPERPLTYSTNILIIWNQAG